MSNILFWILFGALAGWLASLLTGTRRSILGDIILGILGALIGGWIVSLITGRGITGFNLSSLIVAVIGSIILIWISRAVRRDTRDTM